MPSLAFALIARHLAETEDLVFSSIQRGVALEPKGPVPVGGLRHIDGIRLFVGLHPEPDPVDVRMTIVNPAGERREDSFVETVRFDLDRVAGRALFPVAFVIGEWGVYRYEVATADAVLGLVPFSVLPG